MVFRGNNHHTNSDALKYSANKHSDEGIKRLAQAGGTSQRAKVRAGSKDRRALGALGSRWLASLTLASGKGIVLVTLHSPSHGLA